MMISPSTSDVYFVVPNPLIPLSAMTNSPAIVPPAAGLSSCRHHTHLTLTRIANIVALVRRFKLNKPSVVNPLISKGKNAMKGIMRRTFTWGFSLVD